MGRWEMRGRAEIVLCSDVILGRGIDQVQRYSCAPHLEEEMVRSAVD